MQNQKTIIKLRPRFLKPFEQFFTKESVGGLLLIIAAFIAFLLANSPWASAYFSIRSTYFGLEMGAWSLKKPLILWVNDALMAVFFLLIGLEMKRELLVGELSRPRDAALSVFAAMGGMIVPALIFTTLNWNSEGLSGWGVPMATDIAFAIGILSLLGSRIPLSIKVFLTALAIVDDLGAVLVIAVFYTAELHLSYLFFSLVLLLISYFFGRFGGRNLLIFWIIGGISWYFMLKSGVHATVAGVLLAFTIPMKQRLATVDAHHQLTDVLKVEPFEVVEAKMAKMEDILGNVQSPLHRLEHNLIPWVSYFIMPVFAFFNAGVALEGEGSVFGMVTIGCFLGLVVGKPVGIVLFSWVSTKIGISALPAGVGWLQIFGVGLMAGIGFTMSFFIANLAYGEGILLDQAKIGVLAASIIAAILGMVSLYMFTPRSTSDAISNEGTARIEKV